MTADHDLAVAFADGLRPPPERTASQWADEFRVLSAKASAEPGRWRTSRTPYLREIMDVMSPQHPATHVDVMKGSQIGVTEGGNNVVGYYIHYEPCPILMVLPKEGVMRDVSKQRLTPMIESCPALAARVHQDNVEDKHYPGGVFFLRTARSASGLASMPIRIVVLDEVDRFPVDVQDEGSPVKLAERRTATYGKRRKIMKISTPTIKGASAIESSYLESDQRRYFVPCPHCEHYQTIEWSQIKWERGRPETAYLECEACTEAIEEGHKTQMLDRGEWRATNPDAPDHHVGFHLSAFYSPAGWYSWADAVRDFLEAKDDPVKLKVWVNTVPGETWELRGEVPDHQKLFDLREGYPIGTVPEGALLLTAGVDVQKDRLECEVVGWGPGRESWSVDHYIFEGDVRQQAVWQELEEVLEKDFPHELGGSLRIKKVAVDSGYATSDVYSWALRQDQSQVMVIKGSSRVDTLLAGRSKTEAGVPLWTIGVDEAKSWLYGRLRLRPEHDEDGDLVGYPPGYCHFPEYSEEYFKQLTAEKLVPGTDSKGFPKLTWVLDRPRNEALDLRVYALAAAAHLRVSQYEDEDWLAIQDELEASKHKQPSRKTESDSERRERREQDFWSGQRGDFWA